MLPPSAGGLVTGVAGESSSTRAVGRRPVSGRYGATVRDSRTAPPVCDLGLVDLVAATVVRREARRCADRAIDVDHAAAVSTDQVMVVVADAIFEASRRPGGLDSPDKPFGDQQGQTVVDRLQRDGPDLGPDGLGHGVGRDVRLTRNRPQHRQALGRHLDATFTEQGRRFGRHLPDEA